MVNLTRRVLLRLLAGIVGTGLANPSNSMAMLISSERTKGLAEQLSELIVNKESARIIGIEYLRKHPGESDPAFLVKEICAGSKDGNALGAVDIGKRRTFLQFQRQQDFECGRIVRIHGWMLSVTEARLCALCTFL